MEISWIKITTNIFDDEKIMLIESLPEGDTILVIWFKLLTLAGKSNNNGVFMISDKIPYTDEMLATIFRRSINTVRLALTTFEQFGMIEIVDGIVTLPNWEKHQNIDGIEKIREQTKLRVQKCRAKQKALIEETTQNNEDVTLQLRYVTQENKNKNKNKNLNNNISDTKHKNGIYQNVLLKDSELEKLKETYPDDYEGIINHFSELKEMKGYKYKSDYLAIKNWGISSYLEKKKKEPQTVKETQVIKRDYNENPCPKCKEKKLYFDKNIFKCDSCHSDFNCDDMFAYFRKLHNVD